MEAKRLVVKTLWEQGHNGAQIFKLVGKNEIGIRFINRTIARLRDTGSVKDRSRCGRPRSARTKNRIKVVREKIRRISRRSAGKLALETNTSKRSMRRILNIDLGLKPYRRVKRHGLTTEQKEERVKRCKLLSKRHGPKSFKKSHLLR